LSSEKLIDGGLIFVNDPQLGDLAAVEVI